MILETHGPSNTVLNWTLGPAAILIALLLFSIVFYPKQLFTMLDKISDWWYRELE